MIDIEGIIGQSHKLAAMKENEKVSKDWVDNQQLNLILERIGGKIDGKIAQRSKNRDNPKWFIC
jgi:hypothetical protein